MSLAMAGVLVDLLIQTIGLQHTVSVQVMVRHLM